MEAIRARGIRVHNLKNVDVDIPRGKIVAVCGVSGSGKTSLALDTLYAEGQRRYLESFSAYTRQFLERLEKPAFDSIEGLPAALAVTRGGAQRGNRSTVGTASETLDYLRILFANIARLSCYSCGKPVVSHSAQSVAETISCLPKQKVMLGFRMTWSDIGERSAILTDLQNQGFVRILAGDRQLHLATDQRSDLAEQLKGLDSLVVIVDRLHGGAPPSRTTESLETAFEHGLGTIELYLEKVPADAAELHCETGVTIDRHDWVRCELSEQRRCLACSIDFPDPEPRLFSFNSPLGACPKCEGFGDTIDLDWKLIVPDESKSIAEGAIAPWNSPAYEHNLDEFLDVAEDLGIPTDVAVQKLSKPQKKLIFEGDPTLGFEGIQGFFGWLERKKYKMHVRVFLSRWRSYNTCSECGGQRLTPEALSYKIAGKSISEYSELSVEGLHSELEQLKFSERETLIAEGPLAQVHARLGYLKAVGLGYLQLSRTLRTLSGGEAQRTALTAALGSNLVNMLYVLDEPSVGLHPYDVERLKTAIESLARRGNTVLIVEHEDALLRAADELIEIGPGAGLSGGQITYQGPPQRPTAGATGKDATCPTLEFLEGSRRVPIDGSKGKPTGSITMRGCKGNNLDSIDVEVPLGVLCVVTGVSGSGKSTLVQDTLYPAIAARKSESTHRPLPFKSIAGLSQIDDCIFVDQGPVSRSPRSNPVTYVKAFDEIRKAFAATPDAKIRGFAPGHFSFNSDLGRCPKCGGDGVLQIDMQFLADIQMVCPDCSGSRYRKEILAVRYRDRTIADVLAMSAAEAKDFFRGFPKVQQRLQVLEDVGLEYLQLGQPSTILSSGEAQRLKLAGFLATATQKKTLFLLDEPTTGLHFQDIAKLLECFRTLIQSGHSLLVVEHNLHLIASADFVIDLGPGAAAAGGRLVATGTPREIARSKNSVTGRFLREHFESRR